MKTSIIHYPKSLNSPSHVITRHETSYKRVTPLLDLFLWFSVGFLLMTAACFAFADQPDASATAGEHYVFMENMAFVIAVWFAGILGAVCGYAVTRKHDRVDL